MNTEINPCPACGERVYFDQSTAFLGRVIGYYPVCETEECESIPGFPVHETLEEAIKAWNALTSGPIPEFEETF